MNGTSAGTRMCERGTPVAAIDLRYGSGSGTTHDLRLSVRRARVRARLERLKTRGEIVGFSVITRADVARDPVRGLMMIGIEGRGAERIKRQLAAMSELRAVHSTNGRWDLIVETYEALVEERGEGERIWGSMIAKPCGWVWGG